MTRKTIDEIAKVSFVFAILGFVLGLGSLWYSRGDMIEVWDPEVKRKHDEHEARTTQAYRLARTLREERETTGNQNFRRVEQLAEKESYKTNPYKPERVRGPRDEYAFGFSIFCFAGCLAATGVVVSCAKSLRRLEPPTVSRSPDYERYIRE